MPFSAEDLLKSLDFEVESQSPLSSLSGIIKWKMRIVEPGVFYLDGIEKGTNVWHAGSGYAPLDLNTINSWRYGLPKGKHLLICMRPTLFDLRDLSQDLDGQTKISVWDKEIFAQRVGEAYLSGYLQAKQPNETDNIETDGITLLNDIFMSEESQIILTGTKKIEETEFNQLEQKTRRPVLLKARIEIIQGTLLGPNDTKDIKRMLLVTDRVDVLTEYELLDVKPLFDSLELTGPENIDYESLLSERIQTPSKTGGTFLRWWKFNVESMDRASKEALVLCVRLRDKFGNEWIFNPISGNISQLHH
ncbi:MAG: hypothetical protein VYB50_04810 [Candidatus Thermoplasmatota archaeon]|nr:hypothetical protein [Candidatus Thermoplasmatota archaeon]